MPCGIPQHTENHPALRAVVLRLRNSSRQCFATLTFQRPCDGQTFAP